MNTRFAMQDQKLDSFKGVLDALHYEFADIKVNFQTMRSDLDSLIDFTQIPQEKIVADYYPLKNVFNSLAVLDSALKDRCDSLERLLIKCDAQEASKGVSAAFTNTFEFLHNKIHYLERMSRSCNYELQAVLVIKNDVFTTVRSLFANIGVPYPDNKVIMRPGG